jgi:isochorismate hydrolase
MQSTVAPSRFFDPPRAMLLIPDNLHYFCSTYQGSQAHVPDWSMSVK